MKFITITPGAFMKDALKTSDTTLILFHLLEKDNDYHKACLDFKRAGGKIILDNGFYENMSNPPISELAYKANLVKADVLVLPDLPMSDDLRHKIRMNINLVRGYGYYGKLMMCVWAQGKDWDEDLQFFKILNSINELDIIAIPYCFGTRERDKFQRPYFLDLIQRKVNLYTIQHQIHLFGTPSWIDLKESKKWWINSIDGTLPWKVGFANKILPIAKNKEPGRPKCYFNIKFVNDKQRECIDYNCDLIKREIAKDGRS